MACVGNCIRQHACTETVNKLGLYPEINSCSCGIKSYFLIPRAIGFKAAFTSCTDLAQRNDFVDDLCVFMYVYCIHSRGGADGRINMANFM